MKPVEPSEINFIASLLVVTAAAVGITASIAKPTFNRHSRWSVFWSRYSQHAPAFIALYGSIAYLICSWSAIANANTNYRIISLSHIFEEYFFLIGSSLLTAAITASKPFWVGTKSMERRLGGLQ